MVIKAIVVLIIELVTCYLFGTFVNQCILKRRVGGIDSMLIGFFLYQILCQILTLGCYFTTGVVHQLSYTWAVIVLVISVVSMYSCRKEIVADFKTCYQCIKIEKAAVAIATIIVLAVCYYVAINGETNADSQYYIALINTTASTDTLYKYNPYNGFESDAFFLRRALANFEAHSAILCQLYQLPALVIARITRAIQNVILTSAAVCLWGKMLYQKESMKRRVQKTSALVVVYLAFQFVFSCNYHTNAAFFLKRAYEGKAFTANVVLLFVLYTAYQYVKTKERLNLIILILIWWGSVALSSSAMVLVPMAVFIMVIPTIGRKRCRI